MATLREKLDPLHELVIDQILTELCSGEASNETRRLTLQQLRQNEVLTPLLIEGLPTHSRLASSTFPPSTAGCAICNRWLGNDEGGLIHHRESAFSPDR